MEEATLNTSLGAGRIRYQRKTVTIPTLSAITYIQDDLIALDNSYDRCIGVCIQDRGVLISSVVGLGLIGDNDTIIDIVNTNLLVPSTDVPMNTRFMPVNISAKGRQYTIRTQPFVAIGGADCVFDVIFMLIRDQKEAQQ